MGTAEYWVAPALPDAKVGETGVSRRRARQHDAEALDRGGKQLKKTWAVKPCQANPALLEKITRRISSELLHVIAAERGLRIDL